MLRLFTVIVLVLAGSFSLTMVVMFSFVLAERHWTISFAGISPFARFLMFIAAIANAAIVLLYLFEWNC